MVMSSSFALWEKPITKQLNGNYLIEKRLFYCLKVLKRRMFKVLKRRMSLHGGFKSITELSNQGNFFSISVFFFFLSRTLKIRMKAWKGNRTILNSSLPFPPAHKHSDIYLLLCM